MGCENCDCGGNCGGQQDEATMIARLNSLQGLVMASEAAKNCSLVIGDSNKLKKKENEDIVKTIITKLGRIVADI